MQQAIDDPDTQDGDTFRICAGTYTENVNVNKSLTLIGAGEGADGTGLLGTGSGSAVSIGPAVTTTLRSLRITGGNADFGSGVFNNGDLTLTHCTITENEAANDGGGIYSEFTSSLTMNGCRVRIRPMGLAVAASMSTKCLR